MQKDFHYDVTYIVARWAGYSEHEAYVIAYSSQFVDDAADEGPIRFDTGAMYTVISSSHAAYDFIHNTDEISNKMAWLPFHFLPGNCNLPCGEGADRDMVERLICQPNSYVAKEMVLHCLDLRGPKRTLQRLGITLHVYADTWAHKGFCGVVRDQNRVKWLHRVENPWTPFGFIHYLQNLRLRCINILPLGHAAASVYPDMPYLNNWAIIFADARGAVRRHNTTDFVEAADCMYKTLVAFRHNLTGPTLDVVFAHVPGLSWQLKETLRKWFRSFRYKSEDVRHCRWQRKIAAGTIPGVSSIPPYVATGRMSWKYMALGDAKNGIYHYTKAFERSKWKLFYDALKGHRQFVLRTLLPSFGISAFQTVLLQSPPKAEEKS